MRIRDNQDQDVLWMSRPLACSNCCCPCCLQSMEVTSPTDGLLGSLRQDWTLCKPKFSVLNAAGDVVLKIEGPCIPCRCFADVEFFIYALDGVTQVGKITKQFSGLLREAFTDAGECDLVAEFLTKIRFVVYLNR